MSSVESAPIHLVSKHEDRQRYSFIFPVDSYPNPRRIMLQERNGYRDGGGYVGSIGGKYLRYRSLTDDSVELREHIQIGMLREFFQETGLKPRKIIYQAHITWNNIQQGNCTGNVFYVEVEDLYQWRTTTPEEGLPYLVDVPGCFATPRLLPLIDYVLTHTMGVKEFKKFRIPERNTRW